MRRLLRFGLTMAVMLILSLAASPAVALAADSGEPPCGSKLYAGAGQQVDATATYVASPP